MQFDNAVQQAQGVEPLLLAIRESQLDAVISIVESGFDIECDNNIALKTACELGNIEITKFLLENDANIQQNNNEALFLAVANRHTGVTAYLLAKGADIEDRNGSIWELATKNSSLDDSFARLIAVGLVCLKQNDLHMLIDDAFEKHDDELAETLLRAFSFIDPLGGVEIAVYHGKTQAALNILSRNRDIDFSEENSVVLLWEAWHRCDKSLLPALINAGVSVADALADYYLTGGHAEISWEERHFLKLLLELSNNDKEAREYAALTALEIGDLDIAEKAIKSLAEFPDILARIFTKVLFVEAKPLYSLMMSLNVSPEIDVAAPEIHRYETESIFYNFIFDEEDHDFRLYLLLNIVDRVSEFEGLADNAIAEEDWDWLEQLIYLGIEPTFESVFSSYHASDFVEKTKNDKEGKFAFFLQLAERGFIPAIKRMISFYTDGNGVEKDREKANYWRAKLVSRLS